MANIAHQRSALSDLGGKHLQDHKLVYDTPNGVRCSNQRPACDDTAQGNTHHTGGRGSAQSTGEEATNEDDDEDSSASKEDEQEDEEDDPEVLAPSHGRGKGKGKRPAIRIESADEDESQDAEDETVSHETGHITRNHLVNQFLNGNKKRTFSNVSSTSLLFGEDDAGLHTFPRPKVARTLSHSGGTGLLTYKTTSGEGPSGLDTAIQSFGEESAVADAGREKAADDYDDNDDEEDYSGVALLSDSESDVEKMEQQEEDYIIQDEWQNVTDLFSQEFNDARRPSLDSYGSDSIFDFDAPLDGSFYTPVNMQDIGFGQFFESERLPKSPEPITRRKLSSSSTKRVRFDDEVQVSDSSSSTSSELDSATFPDLFLEQDKLPPSLYQLMETDNDIDDGNFPSSASEHSYWDVGQDEPRNLARLDNEEFDSDEFEDSSDPGSSGYETDIGDTTDECDSDIEMEAPPRTPRQKSVLHCPSSAPGSKAASPKQFPRSAIGPKRGFFNHTDSHEAIAVTNRNTKTLTFYRPRVSISFRQSRYIAYSSGTSTTNNSPRTSIQQLNVSDSEIGNDVFCNPFMNSTDIMLTGIFGSAPANASLFGGESIGPPEAFYPFINIRQNGTIMSDEDEYDDEFDNDVNIADFMDFGSDIDATDLEQEDDTDVPATPATSMIVLNSSTPAQPTPLADTPLDRKRNASDAMLEHFDRAGVTAFRNNQNRYRDIACLPHDPNLRASVSRPIRSGRSAEALMSPLRKRSTASKTHGSSPFAGVTKATGRLQSSIMNGRRGPPMGTFS